MGEVIPYHDSSCSSQEDGVVEEAARSCDFVAGGEAEVPGYKVALNPSSTDLMETSALVCIPAESDSLPLIERVCSGKGSAVLRPDL